MKPLVFMVSTETYMENGDVFVDGVVTFDDHEIFRAQVVDPREAEDETVHEFARALRAMLEPPGV